MAKNIRYSRDGIDEKTRRHLTPYWFPLKRGFGIGVTAYSEEQAFQMANECLKEFFPNQKIGDPIAGITMDRLDKGHVVTNMGPINFLGVWYPKKNL